MILDLVNELRDVIDAVPALHTRYLTLKLLRDAILRNLAFLNRHPTTLFQCTWNVLSWDDVSDVETKSFADREMISPTIKDTQNRAIARLVREWRRIKESTTPGFAWLQAGRRPFSPVDVRTKTVLRGHWGAITSLAASPNGRLLASSAEDNTVRVWDIETGQMLHTFEGSYSTVAFEADSDVLVACTEGALLGGTASSLSRISVWSCGTGQLLRQQYVSVPLSSQEPSEESADADESFITLSEDVDLVQLSSDARHLLIRTAYSCWFLSTASAPGEYGPGTYIEVLPAPLKSINPNIIIGFEMPLLAFATGSGHILIWNIEQGVGVAEWPLPAEKVHSFAFMADRSVVAVSTVDSLIRLFAVDTGQCIGEFTDVSTPCACMTFLSAAPRLAVARSNVGGGEWTDDKPIVIELLTLTTSVDRDALFIRPPDNSGKCVRAITPDGNVMVIQDGNQIVVQALADDAVVHCLSSHVVKSTRLACSPDSNHIAVSEEDGHIVILSLSTGNPIGRFRTSQVNPGRLSCLSWSSDGVLLAGGFEDGRVVIWNVYTGDILTAIHAHDESVLCLAFAENGSCLATGSVDGVCRIWDRIDHHRIAELSCVSPVWDLAFTGDGARLIVVEEGMVFGIWGPSFLANELDYMKVDGGPEVSIWSVSNHQRIEWWRSWARAESWAVNCGYHAIALISETVVQRLRSVTPIAWASNPLRQIVESPRHRIIAGSEDAGIMWYRLEGAVPDEAVSTILADECPL